MSEQLNFTQLVLGVDDGAGGFTGDSYNLTGVTRATLLARPLASVSRRDPNGQRSVEKGVHFSQAVAIEGEFHPSPVWEAIFAGFLQSQTDAASTPTAGFTTSSYSMTDTAPEEWRLVFALDGGEGYDFSACVLTSISISWAAGQLPAFRADWLVRNESGAPEGAPAITVDTPHNIGATGAPHLTRAYMRINQTAWGTLADHEQIAQSAAIRMSRDLQPAQYTFAGIPSKWSWSGGIDVSGRLIINENPDNAGELQNLIGTTTTGIVKVVTPTDEHADGFEIDLLALQMGIPDADLKADSWATRVVQFVNLRTDDTTTARVDFVNSI